MINFIFVLDNDGNLVYGWTPDEVENYIEKKTSSAKSIFAPMHNDFLAPESRSKGLQEISDAEMTIRAHQDKTSVLWVTGNAILLKRTLDVADKLYVTQIDRFDSAEEEFVPFGENFYLAKKGKLHRSKNGVVYQHQVWYANRLATHAQDVRNGDTRES